MFGKLLHALLWAKVMSRSRAGLISEALQGIRKIEEKFGLRPYEEAVKYSLVLRMGDYAIAEKELKAFVKRYDDSVDENTRYSVLYCQSILHGISGDLDAKRAAKAKALDVQCDPGVKRWLPL
jgi:hypothetical protein